MRHLHVVAAALLAYTSACGEGGSMPASDEQDLPRPPAPAARSLCAANPEGVSTIERPMFPDNLDSPTFGYSYKVFPGTDPSAPAVVFLTGGPGQIGITEDREPPDLPASFTLIQTDARGLGCNAPETAGFYPPEFYRSRHAADDIVAVIEELGLDDYLIYGVSYGSLLGTMVASRIEAKALPLPRAVVLEGVLGTAFSDKTPGPEVGFEQEWRQVRDRLDPAISRQLEATPLPLDLSPEQWGNGLAASLIFGASPQTGGESLTFLLLQGLAPEATDDDRAMLEDVMVQLSSGSSDPITERLHHEVACHEIVEDEVVSTALEDGELVPVSFDCDRVELTDPFFAGDWPITAPLYYFSGTDDPNTPPWQVEVHFAAQTGAPRSLVHVPRAGHNPRELNLGDCALNLWQAMAAGDGFEATLRTCSWPTDLVRQGAGE